MTNVWKPPDDAPIPVTEFGWDAQLNATESGILKEAVTKVFNSIIQREREPYRRTILLGRIIQDMGIVAANLALKYSMEKVTERRNNHIER